jgi:hypothetical protein
VKPCIINSVDIFSNNRKRKYLENVDDLDLKSKAQTIPYNTGMIYYFQTRYIVTGILVIL